MEIPIYEYYETLPRNQKKEFRMNVCRRCNIEAHQFYRRMRKRSLSALEEKEIRNFMHIWDPETRRDLDL